MAAGNKRIYIIIGTILFFSVLYFFGDNKYLIWAIIISYFAIFFFGISSLNSLPAGKIERATQSKLIFNIRPVFSWIIAGSFGGIIAGILVIYSLIAAFSLPAKIELSCDRIMSTAAAKIECKILEESFFGRVMKNIEISQLTKATLKITYSDAGISYYHIILHDGDKKAITFDWHRDFEVAGYQDLRNKINSFIGNYNEANLTIIEDDRAGYFFVFLFTIFLVSFFILLANIAANIYCCLDRESNNFILKRTRLLFLTTRTSQLALNEIDRAVLEYGEETSRISLKLTSGETFPLTNIYDSVKGKEEIVNAIEQFIKTSESAQKKDN